MAQAVIMVVDDDIISLRMMSKLLTIKGYEVIAWHNAATVYDAICERQPDVVTLDLYMQEDWRAGLHILECLQANPATRAIPVILVSATADMLDDDEKPVGERAFARLVKPVVPQALFDLVAAALQHRSAS